MKKITYLVIAVLTFSSLGSMAQDHKSKIDAAIEEREAVSHIRFLASDELMGRDPIRPEIDAAARYIAEQFWKYGAKEIPGANGFYQHIPFRFSGPPSVGIVKIGSTELKQGEDMLVLDGKNITGSYDMVVAGYGLEADFSKVDVAGKIVVVRVGAPNKLAPAELFEEGRAKLARAQAKGAVGLIEMYNVPTTPWNLVTRMLNRTQLTIDATPVSGDALPYMWVKDLDGELIAAIDKGEVKKAEVNVQGKVNRAIVGKNVVAWIEGTDPQLKNEYLMLSAHYDHVGVGRPDASGDSIYNGTRDNAVGTVAVINAAKYFAKNPPKRSVLLCAWTAEEKGLLGSGYFANNPLVPLNQIIYNLNIDNAGYNDTSIITVIGLGRTTADNLIEEAVAQFGKKAVSDPAPEQGLYDRSDNVNFARKGIPAPTFSLGFTEFGAELNKYYHQPADQVDENFDLAYALVYWKAYILSAQKIADRAERPKWQAGDKYEAVSKELYGTDN